MLTAIFVSGAQRMNAGEKKQEIKFNSFRSILIMKKSNICRVNWIPLSPGELRKSNKSIGEAREGADTRSRETDR